jgi:hypothetical protein
MVAGTQSTSVTLKIQVYRAKVECRQSNATPGLHQIQVTPVIIAHLLLESNIIPHTYSMPHLTSVTLPTFDIQYQHHNNIHYDNSSILHNISRELHTSHPLHSLRLITCVVHYASLFITTTLK